MKAARHDSKPVILLTGSTGQLGFELRRELATLGKVITPSSAELDLAEDSAPSFVRELAPDVLVNAAAYTAVDRAESDIARCAAVNAAAPGLLAAEMQRLGGLFVHFSTDYVFNGCQTRPYLESDPVAPLNVYGETKAEGERRVTAVGGDFLIFRTSWVYGMRGRNFLRTVLDLAHARDEMRVVADQTGSPTSSRMLAVATAQILAQLITERAGRRVDVPSGVYHMTAAGATSWYGFASEILALDPLRDKQRCENLIPITSEEYPTPAARPRYSVMNNSSLHTRFGVELPDWRVQLSLAMSC